MKNFQNVNTVVIADSHAIVREGIKDRLENSGKLRVVAEAEDGFSALKACRDQAPNILLMDFLIQRPSGRELLTKVKKSCPETRIIVLCSEMKIANAFFCLSNGAMAFIPKQASGSDFVNATNAATRGYSYMPTEFISEFLETRNHLLKSGNIFVLSRRELEIVDSCMRGKTSKEVAADCNISLRTVETHKSNMYRKTSCRNIQELTQIFSN